MHTGFLWWCLKEIGQFEDIDIDIDDDKIILKWILKIETNVVDWIYVVQDGEKCQEGGGEDIGGYVLSGSRDRGNFLG
jgi:hypothetical protein